MPSCFLTPPPFCPQLVRSLLTWALVLHLALAVWMYGNSETLESGPVQLGSKSWADTYEEWVSGQSGVDKLGVRTRLLRGNVFPIALLLLVILGTKIVRTFVAGPMFAFF